MYICRYSCDEGMNWSDFTFASFSVVVWGIITEPGETTTQLMSVTHITLTIALYPLNYIHRLFGTRFRSSSSNWIVFPINFTNIFLRTCEASDYSNWTVSDGVNLLKHKILFK